MSLTVLYAPEVRASKGNGAIRLGYRLSHASVPVTSFGELVIALEALRPQKSAYVIRGEPAESAPPRLRRRSSHEPYHIVDAPRQWLLVDVDDRPSAIDAFTDTARAVAAILSVLPGGLSQAACYYALTANCKPHSIRVHMWFWLDRPYSNVELRRYFSGLSDTSIYTPVQPHFTAEPSIPNDPIADRRRGILEGTVIGWLGKEPLKLDPDGAEQALQSAMAEIAASKAKGPRHPVVNRRAYFMGRFVCSGSIERLRVIECLISAAEIAGLSKERATDEVQRGLADGIRDAPLREAWLDRLETSGQTGAPKSSYLNSIIALSESPDWTGCLGWSQRHHRVEWLREPPLSGGYATARQGTPLRDEHAAIAAEWLARHHMSFTRPAILDSMIDVAHKQPFDPVRERLDELDWDGTHRDLAGYLGCAPGWATTACRRWLIAAVARAYQPGCRADNILVLEGPQGRYKSTALDVLGMGWTKDVRTKVDDKDAADALHSGVWIAVWTELDAFKASHRAEAVKAFLSMIEDYFRRSYARTTQSHLRSIVFAATTNEDAYLIDPTGNRRFWPIRCGRIAIDDLRRDCEQIWAEVRQAYLDGEQWWLRDDELTPAAVEQEARLIPDTWEEYVGDYLRGLKPTNGKVFVTLKGIADNALMMTPSQQSLPSNARIQRYLVQEGYHMCIRNGNRGYEKEIES